MYSDFFPHKVAASSLVPLLATAQPLAGAVMDTCGPGLALAVSDEPENILIITKIVKQNICPTVFCTFQQI